MDDVNGSPRRVEVLDCQRLLDAFLRVDRVQLRHERYDGGMSRPLTRLVVDRGHSVAVLPYDPARRRVILVRQFRYPAYADGGPGWLWEIIAGVQDGSPEQVVRTEARQEAGLHLAELRHITTVYLSPGACTERVAIYIAPSDIQAFPDRIAGLAEEGEDILVRSMSLDEALEKVHRGEICDAKSVIALQYLALHWNEL